MEKHYANPAYGRHMTGKQSKTEVDYESQATGKDKCRDCLHFQTPAGCEKVQGRISAEGWCKLFKRRK